MPHPLGVGHQRCRRRRRRLSKSSLHQHDKKLPLLPNNPLHHEQKLLHLAKQHHHLANLLHQKLHRHHPPLHHPDKLFPHPPQLLSPRAMLRPSRMLRSRKKFPLLFICSEGLLLCPYIVGRRRRTGGCHHHFLSPRGTAGK